MKRKKIEAQGEEVPITELLSRIKGGRLDPRMISKEDRLRCVLFLYDEGHDIYQIAKILDRSERTVKRDFAEIRQRNAVSPSVELARQSVGEMFHYAHVHHSHLMKLARSPKETASVKAQSEFMAWRILKELIEKLQSLGYCPKQADKITGEFTVYSEAGEDSVSFQSLRQELAEIEQIGHERGGLSLEGQAQLHELKQKLALAEMCDVVSALKKQQSKEKENQDGK